MSAWEFIAGILMIFSCVTLILLVLSQESKGQGLSGVITGVDGTSNETRGRTKEARRVRFTKYAAIALFVLTIVTNVVSALLA